jgi:hypothetical protein
VFTGSGESVFVIERSATPTVDVAVAELFPGVLSFAEETVAVFEIVPGDAGWTAGAVTVIVTFEVVLAASVARVHVTVPELLLHVHPAPEAETKLVPDGSGSDTLTEFATIVDELLVTPSVYVSVPPVATGSGLAVFVIETSATPTVVVWVAVSLPGVLSFGDETVAVFEIVPGGEDGCVKGAVTTSEMGGVSLFDARLPPV